MFRLAAIVLLALAAPLAAQGLKWENTTASLDLEPGGGKTSGEFRFTNTSDHTVTIRSVPASCGCVASKPEKLEYAPGENGIIPFTYTPKKKWGTFAYRLYVVTDEKGIKPYPLVVEVTERRPAPTRQ
ncbi:MAG: DUF1573 domain-containing protein [Chthoniobacterales bacterium]|nr:DUF1573 domain-containing protein [Chthoniobacterales bacterium]